MSSFVLSVLAHLMSYPILSCEPVAVRVWSDSSALRADERYMSPPTSNYDARRSARACCMQ